jgi:hypothetical protein
VEAEGQGIVKRSGSSHLTDRCAGIDAPLEVGIGPERIESITFHDILAAEGIRNPRGYSLLRVVADDTFPVRKELRAFRIAPRRMVVLRLRFFIGREAEKNVISQQLRFRDAAPGEYLSKTIARCR